MKKSSSNQKATDDSFSYIKHIKASRAQGKSIDLQ